MSASQPQPWGQEKWLNQQVVQRSYANDVLNPLKALHGRNLQVVQYGALSHDPDRYPLMLAMVGQWSADKPTILLSGGVHGYETSGVTGALEFLKTDATEYAKRFNLVVAPCVAPWGYETINRWNPLTQDPNRGFTPGLEIEEARLLIQHVRANFKAALDAGVTMHMDLHEATEDDPEKFEPAKAARDGLPFNPATDASIIPPGFFVINDVNRGAPNLEKAIIDAARPITAIAQPDQNGEIYGAKPEQEGVIYTNIPDILGLFSNPRYAITTEQYGDRQLRPDKVRENTEAQVAAVHGALDHLALDI